MLTTLEGLALFPRQEGMPANERFSRRGCFVGIQNAKCIVRIVFRKTRSILDGSSRTAPNGPEVKSDQTRTSPHGEICADSAGYAPQA